MQRRLIQSGTSLPGRGGFSLVELMVVMVILGILASIAWAVLGRTGEAARKAQTMTTIRELHSLLKTRYDEVRKDFDEQERKNLRSGTWANILNGTTHSVFTTEPAATRKSIVRLDRYRGFFPQRKEDLYGLDGDATTTADNSPLLALWLGTTSVWNNVPRDATKHTAETESSELLWLALRFGATTGAGQDVYQNIKLEHIQDTDGDGIPEFLDGWGRPLRFYNAPTRLIRPAGVDQPGSAVLFPIAQALMPAVPAAPADVTAATDFSNSFNQDPFDPRGSIRKQPFTGDRWMTNATLETYFHTPDTWYQPLIVSCGPDEVLGLGEPTATGALRLGAIVNESGAAATTADEASAASDNLTNLQRVGG